MYGNYPAATNVPVECVATVGGVASFILLVALPLAILLTWLTIVLYRRRVVQAMRSVSPEDSTFSREQDFQATTPPSSALEFNLVESNPSTSPLAHRANLGARRAGFAYAIAGLVHASIATVLTFIFGDIELLPLRVSVVWLLYAWPVIPALMLTSVNDPRWKWAMLVGYFAIFLIIDWGLSAFGLKDNASSSLIVTWLVWMGPPSVLLWILSNRAWRSVGLLTYLVVIALVAAYLLSTYGFACLVLALNDVSLWINYRYTVFGLALALLFAAVWWVLRSIAGRYRDKRLSSTSLTLDSWWLVVTIADIVIQYDSTNGASVSFIFAYFAYLWVRRALLSKSVKSATQAESLLLLRVFGHRRRSRKLLDRLGQRWNFIGLMSLLAASAKPEKV